MRESKESCYFTKVIWFSNNRMDLNTKGCISLSNETKIHYTFKLGDYVRINDHGNQQKV